MNPYESKLRRSRLLSAALFLGLLFVGYTSYKQNEVIQQQRAIIVKMYVQGTIAMNQLMMQLKVCSAQLQGRAVN